MINLYGCTLEEIHEHIRSFNIPAFRAKQIAQWMYQKNIDDFREMTNLPSNLRIALSEVFVIEKPHMIRELKSDDGNTEKFLLQFEDGETVETVLMRHDYGNSICVSSQIGCPMGCVFCASAINGFKRNLTAAEMLSEVNFIYDRVKNENQKIDSLVIMGMGEPLLNYDNVLKFIRLLHEKYTLGMGYRNITLSTSGIVPGIDRLAKEEIPITLSVSLHAPNNKLRSVLMPVNKKYDIDMLFNSIDNFVKNTNRRVTYEYILIDGVNDSNAEALALCDLLKNRLAHVNLIPINGINERKFKRPPKKRIENFMSIIEKHHISVTVRKEMGTDIQAACGQLRNRYMK